MGTCHPATARASARVEAERGRTPTRPPRASSRRYGPAVPARLYAYLSYPDAAAALSWLEAVGFATVRRQDGDDGSGQHAEVRLGDAVVMVASDHGPRSEGRRGAQEGRSRG